MREVYLDNAATTFPKPEIVYRAMERFAREVGGNPGRSGHHRALEAGRTVLQAREKAARLLGVDDPSRIIFTKNATEAINLVIQGVLGEGGHVIITSLEHNSVWRPVSALVEKGLASCTVLRCTPDGYLDPSDLRDSIIPETKLVACTHASNVLGVLLPVEDMASIAAEAGIPLLLDAAQTAGRLPIDVEDMGVAFLAFTGHKELFGPQGTGGLYIAPGWEVEPLNYGGTGSMSENPRQPDFLPDRYESGTLNALGLAGLGAGVDFILQTGLQNIVRHEEELSALLLEGLLSLRGLTLYGPRRLQGRVGIFSFNLEGFSSSELASLLDEKYGICVRSGLHCAPLAHRSIGTLDRGTVRASLSYMNTAEDVEALLHALAEIEAGARK
jgi:cysteine desulfurase family protein